jgi:DNA-binding response OmpR family regulator
MTDRRGQLRVYLGAAPGVGKTFAMLGEGRRRAERGTDVVVGLVECHGRRRTEDQLAGLEVVPRVNRAYRDIEFTEMDVDAVLARRPQVVLVDELAHTNVPGGRHEKRWQDIEELLEAGITVITTVNIQHLESLNDVVARITGIPQRETVPDAMVRAADQIELVLNRGADDYVTKPFSMRQLHGQIRAALRRHDNPEPAAMYPIGDWVVDLTAHTVSRPDTPSPGAAPTTNGTAGDNAVHLTRTEWNLLEVLLRNAGKLVESQELLAQVWGSSYQRESSILRFYISRLRGKLEAEPSRPRHLLTEPGYGYRYRA